MPESELDFEEVARAHYVTLFRLALSLTRNEAEACDLTQQAFYRLATRKHQLLDPGKVKWWLITTLRREFYHERRRQVRHPHCEYDGTEHDAPALPPESIDSMDAEHVMDAVLSLDDKYRSALMLFYVDDCSYKEISELLGIPIGTVMSRLARGKSQLNQILHSDFKSQPQNVVALDNRTNIKVNDR